jgi:hypothetical protein
VRDHPQCEADRAALQVRVAADAGEVAPGEGEVEFVRFPERVATDVGQQGVGEFGDVLAGERRDGFGRVQLRGDPKHRRDTR